MGDLFVKLLLARSTHVTLIQYRKDSGPDNPSGSRYFQRMYHRIAFTPLLVQSANRHPSKAGFLALTRILTVFASSDAKSHYKSLTSRITKRSSPHFCSRSPSLKPPTYRPTYQSQTVSPCKPAATLPRPLDDLTNHPGFASWKDIPTRTKALIYGNRILAISALSLRQNALWQHVPTILRNSREFTGLTIEEGKDPQQQMS